MAISALINRHLFTTKVFDSGALTVMASVIHQFSEPGRYHVTIRHGDTVVGTTPFEVSAESTATQLNLDLAALGGSPAARVAAAFTRTRNARAAGTGAGAGAAENDCGCGGGGSGAAAHAHAHAAGAAGAGGAAPPAAASGVPRVSPKGYVQFFVSQGAGGYSASVSKEGGDKFLFETTQLGAGDLFAVSLLTPATFSMTNTAGAATGTIAVTFSKEVAARLKTTVPVYVDASKGTFSTKAIQLSAGQGLVFRIKDTARIVVQQQTEPQAQARTATPTARRFYRVPQLRPRKP
jgi:hypothetical protein